MKLSDYKGEAALDVLADIIEPLTAIIADSEIQELAKSGDSTPMKYIKPVLKNHKKEIIAILARIEDQPVEEYEKTVTVFTLPKQVLDLINDSEVQNLFTQQVQTPITQLPHSGSVTANTEAKEN